MQKFTEKLEPRPFRMDRCAVNQTFSTAEFHLRPCSKHLDAAFCSNMSKSKKLNQSLIQKDLVKHTCQGWLEVLFRCLRKCCNLCLSLSSENACSPNMGWVCDDDLFYISFNKQFLLVFLCFRLRCLLQQIPKAVLGALTCGSAQHFFR